MVPRRLLHLGLVVFCLAALGVTLWSVVRRMGLAAARAGGPRVLAGPVVPPRPDSLPSPVSLLARGSTTPSIEEAPERRALRVAVVSAQQDLARAQESALEGVAEADQPAALARFQEANRQSITDAEADRDKLLKPADPLDVGQAIPGTEAARWRFAAVRRGVIDEGLTLEAAEAKAEAGASNSNDPSHP